MGSDAITAYMVAGPKGIANTKNVGFQYRVNMQSTISPRMLKRKIDTIHTE